MDILQQTFEGGQEPVAKKPRWSISLLISLFVLLVAGIGFVYWQKFSVVPTPIVVPDVPVPLTDSEVAEYRSALPRVYETAEPLTIEAQGDPDFFAVNQDSAVTEVESAPVVNDVITDTYTPSPTAITVPVSAPTSDASVTSLGQTENSPSSVYVEGDISVADVVIEQPDRAEKSPISGTGVVVSVDGSVNQLLVTIDDQTMSIDLSKTTVTTNDGRLINAASLKTNDVLSISGQKLMSAPVIVEATLQWVGVKEFIQVMDMGV